MNQSTFPAYELQFDEATGCLYGLVPEPQEEQEKEQSDNAGTTAPVKPQIKKTFSGLHFQQSLRDGGYDQFYLEPNNVASFLKKVSDQTPGRYLLGEKRDAKAEVQVSPDELAAWIKLTPAKGGAPLDLKRVQQSLKEKGISPQRIIPGQIQKIEQHLKEDVTLLIAKGFHPETGKKAYFERLLESRAEKDLNSKAEGAIDLHDNFEFITVEVGQKLLKKIPPTNGKAGMNVYGKPIPSMPGEDVQFDSPFDGVALSPEDENILVATQKGHPVFSNKGVKVDLVLALATVDIHSGNVDYDGSIVIAGDVESGFDVQASGDILVKGRVARSNLSAGGKITIMGGVLGDEASNTKTRLSCDDNFRARFVNSACIFCRSEVHVDEYVMHSRISANQGIYLGQEKGKGRIIGGYSNSEKEIVAKSVGSEAAVSTLLVLGRQDEKNKKLEENLALLERRHNEHDQLKIILDKTTTAASEKLGNVNLDKLRKIRNTVVALESQIEKLECEVEELKGQHSQPEVKVSGTIYPNVKVNIFGQAWRCELETRRKKVLLKEGRVVPEDLETS